MAADLDELAKTLELVSRTSWSTSMRAMLDPAIAPAYLSGASRIAVTRSAGHIDSPAMPTS